jgi:hypothetical protein
MSRRRGGLRFHVRQGRNTVERHQTPGVQMKTIALTAFSLAMWASFALAEPRRPAPAQHEHRPKAAVAMGRRGEDVTARCSAENPNIEYRDCVNASTRDPSAKVRLG